MLQPKISFVVPARNDNYGGDFLHRMQVSLDCLSRLWREQGLSAELIIVEWNPPAGKPQLRNALRPADSAPGLIRIIEVPRAVHLRRANSDRIAMFEYIAKNVGIRRAEGQFILATNADIIFSRELIGHLATAPLSPGCFYRIDRHDVGAEVPLGMTLDEQLRFCTDNAVRVRTAYGTFPVKCACSANLNTYRGYLRKLWPREAFRWFTMKFVLSIHTGAPGDFTLMSRDAWRDLRGYPELPSQRHVDSYLCSMARSMGLKQVILRSPMRIYHQDHDTAEMARRPSTDYERYWEDTRRMLKTKRPVILNDANWGLGNEELSDDTISLSGQRV